MPTRSVPLAIALVMPLGLGAAADLLPPQPDPAADKAAAKIAQLDQRLESNAKRLQARRARREAVTTTVTPAKEALITLGAQLKTSEDLAAKAQGERASSRNDTLSQATVLALAEASAAAEPMQRSKRNWTRTVTEGKRQLVDLDCQIAALAAERVRSERELSKAAAAP